MFELLPLCGPSVEPHSDIEELTLLVPKWQVEALSKAAAQHGVSVGQLLRRLCNEFLLAEPRT